jgi:hypothetical protein
LLALGVHSVTDYVWHVPVIPVVAAIVAGICLGGSRDQPAGG